MAVSVEDVARAVSWWVGIECLPSTALLIAHIGFSAGSTSQHGEFQGCDECLITNALGSICYTHQAPRTISFFPQAMLNQQRKTTQGLMPDFPLLNVFGFSCYSVSTLLFLFSPVIRGQYASRHPLSPEPTVRINDLAFGLLGLIMSVVVSEVVPGLPEGELMLRPDRPTHNSGRVSGDGSISPE
jgi:uncharacterized protein with PQ loop repeat